MPAPEFFKKAACRGLSPELFYLEIGEPGLADATDVCKSCDVRMECLLHAIEMNETNFGIWGGVGPRSRRPSRAASTIKRVEKEIAMRHALQLKGDARRRAVTKANKISQ